MAQLARQALLCAVVLAGLLSGGVRVELELDTEDGCCESGCCAPAAAEPACAGCVPADEPAVVVAPRCACGDGHGADEWVVPRLRVVLPTAPRFFCAEPDSRVAPPRAQAPRSWRAEPETPPPRSSIFDIDSHA